MASRDRILWRKKKIKEHSISIKNPFVNENRIEVAYGFYEEHKLVITSESHRPIMCEHREKCCYQLLMRCRQDVVRGSIILPKAKVSFPFNKKV